MLLFLYCSERILYRNQPTARRQNLAWRGWGGGGGSVLHKFPPVSIGVGDEGGGGARPSTPPWTRIVPAIDNGTCFVK